MHKPLKHMTHWLHYAYSPADHISISIYLPLLTQKIFWIFITAIYIELSGNWQIILKLFFKNLVFTLVVPGTVAVYIPVFIFPHAPVTLSLVALSGVIALAIGLIIYTWCIWDFGTAGRGTPAPIDPPKALVIGGLYNYTRNPMYLGVLCIIAGWALLFQSLGIAIYALCVAIVFHLFILFYEEPHLKSIFGASYGLYCNKVSRWLPFPSVPRIPKKGD